MRHFRHSKRSVDPLWDVASGTEVLVADEARIASLARNGDLDPLDTPIDGVVVGTRHPTGWFVHAIRRLNLPVHEHGPFRELVAVRAYLLLAHGPQAPAWFRTPGGSEWRSVCLSPSPMLRELDSAFAE